MADTQNRYVQIIKAIFSRHYRRGMTEVPFERSDIVRVADELGIKLPKNLGDVLYSFRYRTPLPESIVKKAPAGYQWIIRPAGRARYVLIMAKQAAIIPSDILAETKILDATPGVIAKYALTDEQALLARLRYNRLIDVFTGLTCYSLQNHLRTTVAGVGQVETDEIYVGIDKRGAQFVLPVQAKGRNERLGIVQIEQDIALCAEKFPNLVCRSIAAQAVLGEVIALFEFEKSEEEIRVSSEKHYRLVRPEELSPKELKDYQKRPL